LIQTWASRPWESVSVDLFSHNDRHFLIIVDRYSGYPFVAPLGRARGIDTAKVWSTLEELVFFEKGYVPNLRSDGGPQFRAPFDAKCEEYGIRHEKSSAYFSQSNGHAEACVKSMKSLVKKCEDEKHPWWAFKVALLEWRNTPRADGLTPSEWESGRRQRTLQVALPITYQRIDDNTLSEMEARRRQIMDREKANYDKTTLPERLPFALGDLVLAQDQLTKHWGAEVAEIVRIRQSGRSYTVKFRDTGRMKDLNNKFLKRFKIGLRPPREEAEHCFQDVMEEADFFNVEEDVDGQEEVHDDEGAVGGAVPLVEVEDPPRQQPRRSLRQRARQQ